VVAATPLGDVVVGGCARWAMTMAFGMATVGWRRRCLLILPRSPPATALI